MKRILIILPLLAIIACQEKIDLTLPLTDQRLVVEGRIEKVKDRESQWHQITLSKTGAYFDSDETPRVNDASVSVSDGDGTRHEFNIIEDHSGTYVNTTMVGEVGQTYTLTIEWQGERYEAVETLTAVVALDTAYQKYAEATTFDDEGIRLAIDFTDPADQENFYFWEVLSNGENTIVASPGNKFDIIATDEFLDGQKISGYSPNGEKIFEAGEIATVRHIGISSAMYDYLYLIMVQTGQGSTFGDTPPALIKGNIQNLTQPDNYALGYFSAVEVHEATLLIEEEQSESCDL